MTDPKREERSISLLRAADDGDAARVVSALNDGALLDVRDVRQETIGRTPLMLAAEGGHAEIAQALLAAGADVNATDDPNGKPSRGIGFVLGEAGLDALRDAKYKLNRTALMYAACGGHAQAVAALLNAGAKVNQKDYAGCTALHLAARHGHPEVVRLLLAAGSKVDQRGPNRQTPMSLAAESGASDAVRLLLEAGASVTQSDADNRSVLDVAAAHGRADLVRLLLEALGDKMDKGEILSRALTFGVRAERGASEDSILSVAEQLVAAGARVADGEVSGPAPLDLAAMNGFERVVALLLAAGAKVNATDAFGMSALFGAVLYHHPDVARLLLEHGADPDLRDEDGKSALDYAREQATDRKGQAILSLLQRHARPKKQSRKSKASAEGRTGRKKKQHPQ